MTYNVLMGTLNPTNSTQLRITDNVYFLICYLFFLEYVNKPFYPYLRTNRPEDYRNYFYFVKLNDFLYHCYNSYGNYILMHNFVISELFVINKML